MKQLTFKSRQEWREWLSQNYNKCDGLWLIIYKKHVGKGYLNYEAAVEEALCYGWIDSILKRIDDEKYAQKFTPRKPKSVWSNLNKQRVKSLIQKGLMTNAGLIKIEMAKNNGQWEKSNLSKFTYGIPQELQKALDQNETAKNHFNNLAPSYRKHYIGWIASAKKQSTKERRVLKAISVLEKGEKLGLK